MKQKTIFIAIAFGTSVRDFLRTEAYQALKRNPKLRIVIFSQEVSPQFTEEFGGENIFFESLANYKPNLIERFLLILHRTILRKKSRTISLGNTSGDLRSIRLVTPLAWFLTFIFGYYGVTKFIGWLYRKTNLGSEYCDFFSKYDPSLLIVTRVLNYSNDYPLLKSAAYHDVSTVALVSSWDNLTSKAFFPYNIESLVVWNDVMRDEALDLYNFDPNKIFISGAPRYDLYFSDPDIPEYDKFFFDRGLSSKKQTILYATGSGSTTTSKYDPTSPEADICEFIADAIEKGEIPNTQLVVRLHPQAIPEHYECISDRFPNVMIDSPGKKGDFQDRYFDLSDDLNYAAWLKYSDLVVNFGSTASLDAAVFDTPIICVNFDFRGYRPYLKSPRKIYEFDHYQKLLSCEGVTLSTSRNALISDIQYALSNPQYLSQGRRRIVNQQCQFTDGETGRRIAQHLEKIISDL